MAKKKHKSKSNPPPGAKRRREKAANFEAGLLGKARATREDRHVLVAMVLASLIAGILFVVNCDRMTNSAAAAELEVGASLHGWPFVYLERRFESLPVLLVQTRVNDWPFFPVEHEIRVMNYQNLLLDIVCGVVIVAVCFFSIRWIVYRYDEWKKSWD